MNTDDKDYGGGMHHHAIGPTPKCPHNVPLHRHCHSCEAEFEAEYGPKPPIPGLEVRELGPAEGLRDWLEAQ